MQLIFFNATQHSEALRSQELYLRGRVWGRTFACCVQKCPHLCGILAGRFPITCRFMDALFHYQTPFLLEDDRSLQLSTANGRWFSCITIHSTMRFPCQVPRAGKRDGSAAGCGEAVKHLSWFVSLCHVWISTESARALMSTKVKAETQDALILPFKPYYHESLAAWLLRICVLWLDTTCIITAS